MDALGPSLWLNAEMVRRGGARVRAYPDTAGANAPLLELEAAAREEGLGLWKLGSYTLPSASQLPAGFEGFQLVTGTVTGMTGSDAYGAVCERELEGSDLRLVIETPAAALCQLAEGTPVRARGYVRDLRMEITHPVNLEVLKAGQS